MASEPSTEPKPLTGVVLMAVAVVLALSNFVVVLDLTIANVSVPHIASGLAVSPTQGTWVVTSYAVAEAIVVPLSGWLAQRFGMVRTFVVAVLCFGLFSALCGMATSLTMLILFRIFQGFAGGPLMPLTQTLMLRVFPKEKRATALTLWAMTTVLGPVAGPIFGGLISDNWSWHWIFLINVPLTIFCGIFSWRVLKDHETTTLRVPIDYVGFVLLVLWVGSLQLMLDKGRELDWFGSPLIVGLAIVAAIGFVAFLIWELNDEHPIVDLRVFRYRGFTAGVAAQCGTFGAYFASIVLIPLWLQTTLGYTATWAGYATAWTGAAAAITSPIAARLITRFDPRVCVSIGIMWVGVFALVRTQWTSGIDFWTAAWPQAIQGIFMPLYFIGVTALALSAVRPDEVPAAAGVMNFMRTLCAAIATALATTLWEQSAQEKRAELVGLLNAPEAAAASLQTSGLSHDQALAVIEHSVTVEATTIATTHIFWATSVIFILAALAVWIAPRPSRQTETSAVQEA